MSNEFYILLLFMFVGFTLLFLIIRNKNSKNIDNNLLEWLKTMQLSLDRTNKSVNDSLRDSSSDMARVLQLNSRQLNERLDNAAKVIGDLKKNVGEMSELGKGIRNLQEYLQSPKMRGNLGEQVLSDMIGQVFPKNSFFLQYDLGNGLRVDAAIKTDNGILCIDSKFPMTNFNNIYTSENESERQQAKKLFTSDVKKHLTDISNKYIANDLGTMDFALMYIPSESVYYEVIVTLPLMDYARSLRVYPVSPNTLYAHLQVLMVSFQGKELENRSREILEILKSSGKEFQKSEEQLSIVNKHLTNAFNALSIFQSNFLNLGKKLDKTKLLN